MTPDRFAWRMPDDDAERLTDDGIAGLVGQVASLLVLGFPTGGVQITAARRYTDESLGPGVWVEAVRWEPPAKPPMNVLSARLRKLDADGQPVGEWINMEGEWAWP